MVQAWDEATNGAFVCTQNAAPVVTSNEGKYAHLLRSSCTGNQVFNKITTMETGETSDVRTYTPCASAAQFASV